MSVTGRGPWQIQKELYAAFCLCLLVFVWAGTHWLTRHERAFHYAFERASAPCDYEQLLIRWDALIEAARRLDRTPSGSRLVESCCLNALHGEVRERWAAGMVLCYRQVELSAAGWETLNEFRTVYGEAAAEEAQIGSLVREIEVQQQHRRELRRSGKAANFR